MTDEELGVQMTRAAVREMAVSRANAEILQLDVLH